MSGVDMLDDYLGELLLDAIPAAAVPAPAAVAAATAPPASPAVVEAAPAPAPVAVAAAVVAPAAPASAPARTAAPATAQPRPVADPVPVVVEPEPPRPAEPAPAVPAGNNVWAALQAQARAPQQPQRRASERTSRWLRLRCGVQAYALELLKVQEVVLPVPLLGLRGTSAAMLGIMNLRGQVVPVIDLGLHLGFAAVGEDSLTRIVVLEERGDVLGLRVSAVEDVANLTESQIEPPDTARICQISNTLFRGVARIGQQPMILLDASELLQCER
ncbi:MAG: purine-binding chemotaxis protein CheW [Stenotrophomonas nitritireducens]|uniref:Chemotaxis protein CheW n=1 Tax=Stenotrophomonas nitritireducens TaxID=83617 RepID=A0A9D8KVU6_9GAMM|nr:purine-binding chemotaxis protein CheW [Stenotrophomonas nitritireducens]